MLLLPLEEAASRRASAAGVYNMWAALEARHGELARAVTVLHEGVAKYPRDAALLHRRMLLPRGGAQVQVVRFDLAEKRRRADDARLRLRLVRRVLLLPTRHRRLLARSAKAPRRVRWRGQRRRSR